MRYFVTPYTLLFIPLVRTGMLLTINELGNRPNKQFILDEIANINGLDKSKILVDDSIEVTEIEFERIKNK